MNRIVPKETNDEFWTPLIHQRDYAVLLNPGDSVFFRLGQGLGMYMVVDASPSGRVVSGLDYESGEPSLIGRLPVETDVILGRTSDCALKVMHAIVSRTHLQFFTSGNVLLVRDLGSTNGTYMAKMNKHFDIDQYIMNHPLESSNEQTIDWVHEAFGPEIDDFLKSYSQNKKEKN